MLLRSKSTHRDAQVYVGGSYDCKPSYKQLSPSRRIASRKHRELDGILGRLGEWGWWAYPFVSLPISLIRRKTIYIWHIADYHLFIVRSCVELSLWGWIFITECGSIRPSSTRVRFREAIERYCTKQFRSTCDLLAGLTVVRSLKRGQRWASWEESCRSSVPESESTIRFALTFSRPSSSRNQWPNKIFMMRWNPHSCCWQILSLWIREIVAMREYYWMHDGWCHSAFWGKKNFSSWFVLIIS